VKWPSIGREQTSHSLSWIWLDRRIEDGSADTKMDQQTKHELLIISIASLAPITLLTGAVVAILL
jgi:hypothetical protein